MIISVGLVDVDELPKDCKSQFLITKAYRLFLAGPTFAIISVINL